MRVIFTHDVTDDTGALFVWFAWLHAGFVHSVDDTALDWF